MPFLLLIICLPLIEIALFVQIGGAIGLWPTLGLVIASSAAGIALMRGESAQSLARLRRNLEEGGDPTGPLAHGALKMIAGILLFVPGFLTSALGLLLLIPPVRRWLIGHGAGRVTVRATTFRRPAPGTARGPTPRSRPGTIDAEYEVIEDSASDSPLPSGRSGWTRPH